MPTNKEIALRFFTSLDAGKLAEAFTLLAADHKLHFPGGPPADKKGHEEIALSFYRAFPDWHHESIRQVAEGDYVVTWTTAGGTHKGEFMGVKATGRKVSITGVALQRIVKGKIAEEWSCFDSLALMQQLGAVPAK